MEWLWACVAALTVVAAFWLPGLLLAWCWRWDITVEARVATAPLVTLGFLGVVAVVTQPFARWGVGTAAAAVLLGCAPGLLLRRPWPRLRSDVPTSLRRSAVGACVVAVGAQLIPMLMAMGRPDAYLTAYDNVTHIVRVALVRTTGQGSSLTMSGLGTFTPSKGGFYGAAWYDAVALVPHLGSPTTVDTMALLLTATVPWVLGLLYLAQVTLPSRPRVWVLSPLLGAAGVGVPVLLSLRPEGMTPNAVGMALLPALCAAVVATWRKRERSAYLPLATGVAGMALTHPNALLTAGVVLLPSGLLVGRTAVLRFAGPGPRRWLRVGLAVVSTLGLVALVVSVVRSPTFQAVTHYPADSLDLSSSVIGLLAGNGTGMGFAAGGGVMVLALLGAALGRSIPRLRWSLWGATIVAVLYLMAISPWPVLQIAAAPWYSEPRRFVIAVPTMLVPAAALCLDSSWRNLRVRLAARRRELRLVRAAVVLLVAAPALSGAAGLYVLMHATVHGDASEPTAVADDAELALADRLPHELDRAGVVLGSPFSGAAHLVARIGQPVLIPSSIAQPSADLLYAQGHLDAIGVDPAVCAALDRWNVRYLYVDSAPWNTRPDQIDLRSAPANGVRLVDSGGTAAVYEVTGCA